MLSALAISPFAQASVLPGDTKIDGIVSDCADQFSQRLLEILVGWIDFSGEVLLLFILCLTYLIMVITDHI